MNDKPPPTIIVQYHEHEAPKASNEILDLLKILFVLVLLLAILTLARSCGAH